MIGIARSLKTAAAFAAIAVVSLAGCGGGSSLRSVLPTTVGGSNSAASTTSNTTMAFLNTVLPMSTTNIVTSASTKRTPSYIDSFTATSSIVVTVTPSDPAEAAQFANLTVCYPLYTGGTLAANSPPNFVVTALPATSGTAAPATANVKIGVPAPPGNDTFQITQYAGTCANASATAVPPGSSYTAPTPPPSTTGSSNILAQTSSAAPLSAYLVPGATNNLNFQIAACTTTPCAIQTTPSAGPGTAITLAASAASIGFGAFPNYQSAPASPATLLGPVRETGPFVNVAGQIGIPIPLQALSASGQPMPGVVTLGVLAPGQLASTSGGYPTGGVTVTRTETGSVGGPHTKLFVVDANTGAVAQTDPGTGLVLTQANALIATDNKTGLGTNGDPYVILLTYDGSAASALATVTVTATGTFGTKPVTISQVIQPQSAVFTAVNVGSSAGYVDPANPLAVKDVQLVTVGALSTIYLTDGTSVKKDGVVGGQSAGVGTTLSGLTYGNWATTPFLYAVDSSQATATNSGAPINSGIYAFAPALGTAPVPVAVQAGSVYFSFNKPMGIVWAPSSVSANGSSLYVADQSNNVYTVDIAQTSGTPDPTGGFQKSTNTIPIPLNPTGAFNFNGASYIGMAYDASTKTIVVADQGNNRLARLNPATGAVTPVATVPSPSGVQVVTSGSSTIYYVSTTSGQLYTVSGSTAASFGLTLTTTAPSNDGAIGVLSLGTTTAAVTAAANPYPLQGQAKNAFIVPPGSVYAPLAPYNLQPFLIAPLSTTSIFTTNIVGAAAPFGTPGLLNDSSSGATATGVVGTVKANGGVVFIPAAATGLPVADKAGTFLFSDTGSLRTIIP